jgi:hypothetical protein
MVNRILEVKRIKMRRRRKKLRGIKERWDDDTVIGVQSLSKQVVGYGLRVPGRPAAKYSLNKEAMAQINPRKKLEDDIPRTLGISLERQLTIKLANVLTNQPDLALHNLIIRAEKLRVYLFFDSRLKNIYLVKIDKRRNIIQRSVNYSSIQAAQDAALTHSAYWNQAE